MVRILGFHPGGPGSNPGVGSLSFFFFSLAACVEGLGGQSILCGCINLAVGTRTLFGNFFGNNGLISLKKNFRVKFANDVIFNA